MSLRRFHMVSPYIDQAWSIKASRDVTEIVLSLPQLYYREQDLFLPRPSMHAPTGSELCLVRPDADNILSAVDGKRKREVPGRYSMLRCLFNRLQVRSRCFKAALR